MKHDLESKLEAKYIVRDAGMCDRPEYYSGRGATMSDLNKKILDGVYLGVKNSHGKAAAENFVKMVAEIPVLSATDFLLSLYRLEQNGWKYDKNVLGNEKGIHIDGPNDDAKMVVGFATIAGMMFGNSRNDTDWIRNEFLYAHGMAPKERIFYQGDRF